MKQVLHWLALGIALPLLHGTAVTAWADDLVMLGDAEELAAQEPTSRLLGAPVLDEAALSGLRGGADTHRSEIRAIGAVSEISVSDAATGHNLITGGALAGASGVPMFIQNSGNGVLIQNAFILNVEVK